MRETPNTPVCDECGLPIFDEDDRYEFTTSGITVCRKCVETAHLCGALDLLYAGLMEDDEHDWD